MRFAYFKYALDNIFHRKLRSFLTALSILIGIAAIFALVSFGQGLANYVTSLSSEAGTDKLMIQAKGIGAPGTDASFYLKKEEIDFIGKINGVSEIAPMYTKVAELGHDDEKKYVFINGIPQGHEKKIFEEIFSVGIEKGRDLKSGDKLKAVLGYNYLLDNKIFKKGLKLNDKLLVNGNQVEIVGFYHTVGNPQDDSNVYFTDQAFELMFPETIGRYQFAIARAAPNVDAESLAEKAKEKLRKHKGQKEGNEDFYIQTFQQAIEIFSTIIGVINAVLVLIALISLAVAAVNIMNTMYTAVLERTREIGVMKAIGAKNSDIMQIFLIESGFLGLVGGFFGVLLGYTIAKIGGVIASKYGYSMLKPIFPLWLIIGCLLFALLVGTFSGILPSKQASKLNPVDALRYE